MQTSETLTRLAVRLTALGHRKDIAPDVLASAIQCCELAVSAAEENAHAMEIKDLTYNWHSVWEMLEEAQQHVSWKLEFPQEHESATRVAAFVLPQLCDKNAVLWRRLKTQVIHNLRREKSWGLKEQEKSLSLDCFVAM